MKDIVCLGVHSLDPLIAIFVVVIVLAGVSVVWFYRKRKVNLMILEKSIRILEKVYQPYDKKYTVIGIYVGYSALYRVFKKALKMIEVVTILIPRQSLLYLPIAKLTSRFDKVFIIYHYDKEAHFPGEAHIVKKGYYRLGIKRAIQGIEKMHVEKTKIDGKTYYLIYNNRQVLDKLLKMVKTLEKPSLIQHATIVPRLHRLYIASRLEIDYLEDIVSKTYLFAQSIV